MPTNKGRRGAGDVTRSLLELASSLSEPGDYVSVEAIERRLGCGREQAQKLFSLLENVASDPEGLCAYEDVDGIAIGAGSHGARALRLDASETFALLCALRRLGVAEDNPLRQKLQGALAAGGVDEALLDRVLSHAPGAAAAGNLAACSAAIASLDDLEFSYLKDAVSAPEHRHVRPRKLTEQEGLWYLECTDLERGGQRTFRIDRMSQVEAARRNACEEPLRADDGHGHRSVEIEFSDLGLLDLFVWPGLELAQRDDDLGRARGTIPYYGGDWLVRQLAGCGAGARTTDPELCGAIVAYAQEQLIS